MVKNSGGNKTKSFARKNDIASNKLRLPDCEFEKFGFVVKLFGGSLCQVFCDNNAILTSVIRGKFRSRKGKRNNMISNGTLVLVGIRDWNTSSYTDILEVYSSTDYDNLKVLPSFPSSLFDSFMSYCNNTGSSSGGHTDDFAFSSLSVSNEQIDENQDVTDIISGHETINIDDI